MTPPLKPSDVERVRRRYHVEGQTTPAEKGPRWCVWDNVEGHFGRYRNIADQGDAYSICEKLNEYDAAITASHSLDACPTCEAKNPDDNEFCSDGFHAKGPTYWPEVGGDDAELVARIETLENQLLVSQQFCEAANARIAELEASLSHNGDELEEPTPEMIEAGQKAIPFNSSPSIIRNIYVAMRRVELSKPLSGGENP